MPLSVEKETEVVSRLITKKTGKPGITIQLKFLSDVSGSARSFYGKEGPMDYVFQRLGVFADRVDPDKTVETFAFASDAKATGQYGTAQIPTMLHSFLEAARDILWGGTDYASAFKALSDATNGKSAKPGFFKNLFGKSDTSAKTEPTLVVFNTDGEDFGNATALRRYVKELIDKDHFILALGVNRDAGKFALLEQLDKEFNGFSFVHSSDYKSLDDQSFYDLLLSDELIAWLKAKGVI